jgi:hypothetical protein
MSTKRHTIALVRHLKAFQDDLELLVLGLASPPTRIHHFKPLDLAAAPITVHKDSSQQRVSLGKGAATGCVP